MERQFRALVVDDSPEDRTLISRALQHEGFVCEVANDGVMAENLLKSKVYDVVVTDLRMPRKHGHQLVVELLEQRNPPVIFVVTGLSEPKLVSDLLERGVADVVQKPLSYPTLAAKIKVLLKKKAGLPASAESSAANRVASSIHSTAENLRQQLSLVTSSFQETIDQLETQRQQLEAGFLDSLRVLSNLISGQGKQSHVGRVEALAECIGRQAGLEEGRMRHLKFAALLHDIGQFGMPDKLRNRPPWMLDEDEFKIFQNYPFVSATLMGEVRGAETSSEIIEAHTENFDGSGFPKGLAGEAILFEARILRVADGCDLFHMYMGQPGDVVEQLHDHLVSEKGRSYDPDVVNLAIGCLSATYAPAEAADNVRPCRVQDLVPGLVLAENIYDEHGHFLARHGGRLNDSMIERLRRLLRGQQVTVYRLPED